MIIRQAVLADIPAIQIVRNAVKENRLSNPAMVSDGDVELFISVRGRGWVCEIDNNIVGFSIADLKENNVWALFIDPNFEGNGIGRKLHDIMLDWYFDQNKTNIWLGTSPGTRAENFYRTAGWHPSGMHGNEVKFTMTESNWENSKQAQFNPR